MQYDPTGLQSFTQWAMGKTIASKSWRRKNLSSSEQELKIKHGKKNQQQAAI